MVLIYLVSPGLAPSSPLHLTLHKEDEFKVVELLLNRRVCRQNWLVIQKSSDAMVTEATEVFP